VAQDIHDDFQAELVAALPYLYRVGRRLASSGDRAEDLVQDGVEQALRKRGRFRGDGSVRSWVAAIMANLHRSRVRRDGRRGVHENVDDCRDLIAVAPPQPAYSAIGRLWLRVRTLPSRERRAIYLAGLCGVSHAELARRERVAPGTIKSRLSRARARLAE
jgi:RNA polymerase sigma-70 factor (ECF subfamily)